MARHIVLGNQELLVNIDKWLQVRDIFFPRVGQYNHVNGNANKIAILEGSDTTWVNEDAWEKTLRYRDDTLLTASHAVNKAKKLRIEFTENVFCEENIFFRKLVVHNEAHNERNIRLCFTHDPELYGEDIGDTAFYHPKTKSVIHYKDTTYLLTGILDDKSNNCLSTYDIGAVTEPAWELSENSIAQGTVQTLLATDITLPPNASKTLTYYMAAGTCLEEVERLSQNFVKEGVETHIRHADMCQRGWAEQNTVCAQINDPDLRRFFKRSLLIIKTQVDKGGAILAANDTDNMQYNKDTYSYLWPRDGALVARAMIRAGYPDFTKEFFRFCNEVQHESGALLHKYNPNKSLGSSWHPWVYNGKPSLPIQEDETALVLLALQTYHEHTEDTEFLEELYEDFVKPAAEFLMLWTHENGLPRESYDLWEERRGIYTFTTSAVLGGLKAATYIAEKLGKQDVLTACEQRFKTIKNAMSTYLYNEEQQYFRRGITYDGEQVTSVDDTIDAAAYATFAFGAFSAIDEKVVNTMEKISDWLHVDTTVGGIARYHDDHYFQIGEDLDTVPGNPWFICTLWKAKWHIKTACSEADLEPAKHIIDWVMEHALDTGVLAEQVHPYTGEPLSVSPLTWSHAEFVDAVTQYYTKKKQL